MDLFVSVNSVKLVSLSIFQPNIKEKYLGGSPGLMVMGRDSCSEKVVASNPRAVYWMDMTFFTMNCCKNCNVFV